MQVGGGSDIGGAYPSSFQLGAKVFGFNEMVALNAVGEKFPQKLNSFRFTAMLRVGPEGGKP